MTAFGEEPEHQDGGASVIHLVLTLYGPRVLACRRGLGLRDVLLVVSHQALGSF